jgi:signal transduction histidine kinase
VGKGTGLGLDIVRRIVVDGCHGEVTFTSAPGETSFLIRLPLTANA